MYFILRLFSSLPLAVIQLVGACAGILIYLISPRYRRSLNKNLQSAAISSGFIAAPWKVSRQSGMMFADILWIWAHPKGALKKSTIEGMEKIIELSKNGKGLIILTAHLGGFEILPRLFSKTVQSTYMYKPARKTWVNALMVKSRQHPGVEFVEANLGGVRKIKRTLSNGGIVGIVADQVPSVADGIWAKFFNQYAYTSAFPIKLARNTEATTLFMSAERLSFDRGWRIQHKVMAQKYPECLIEACTVMNTYFEQMIIAKPNQYMWSYNRYKTPTGAELAPAI